MKDVFETKPQSMTYMYIPELHNYNIPPYLCLKTKDCKILCLLGLLD